MKISILDTAGDLPHPLGTLLAKPSPARYKVGTIVRYVLSHRPASRDGERGSIQRTIARLADLKRSPAISRRVQSQR